MKSLGELLKHLRQEKGYSLREVQAISDNVISHGYLHALERGYDTRSGKPIKPSAQTLKTLAKFYNYPYEKLMVVAGYLEESKETKEPWWDRDETPTDVDLEDFIKNHSNLKLMGNPLDEKAKEDVLVFLRAAHEYIKQDKKKKAAEAAGKQKDEGL